MPFRGNDYKVNPRYSKQNPFRGNEYKVSPRYSLGMPFRGNDYKVNPRYSKPNPFRGNEYKVSPRYSLGMPFRGNDYRVNPRYSEGMPFRGKDYRIQPRYSQGNPFRGMDFKVNPRYSEGMPFRGKDYHISPRYSGTKITFFDIMADRSLGVSKYFHDSSLWEGDMKVSRKFYGDQHPSTNYHFAMKFHNPSIRKALRKWNVYWTRINGNKQNSNGVNEPIDKPKFDKKERVIWNN